MEESDEDIKKLRSESENATGQVKTGGFLYSSFGRKLEIKTAPPNGELFLNGKV